MNTFEQAATLPLADYGRIARDGETIKTILVALGALLKAMRGGDVPASRLRQDGDGNRLFMADLFKTAVAGHV